MKQERGQPKWTNKIAEKDRLKCTALIICYKTCSENLFSAAAEPMLLWTAGFSQNKKAQPIWCHSGEKLPDYSSWPVREQLKSKGDGGNCILAEVGAANAAQLLRTECTEKHNFFCEVPYCGFINTKSVNRPFFSIDDHG
jgi:hypothetical protein